MQQSQVGGKLPRVTPGTLAPRDGRRYRGRVDIFPRFLSLVSRIECLEEAFFDTLSTSIQVSLLELWDQNICPNCGKTTRKEQGKEVDARAKAASAASTATPASINSS